MFFAITTYMAGFAMEITALLRHTERFKTEIYALGLDIADSMPQEDVPLSTMEMVLCWIQNWRLFHGSSLRTLYRKGLELAGQSHNLLSSGYYVYVERTWLWGYVRTLYPKCLEISFAGLRRTHA
jgi:hypothetical protein